MSAVVEARRAPAPTMVLLVASVGCALTVLDTNVVGIVLPTIARAFGARFADVEWVISSYVLCFASLLLAAGAIADRFGRKRAFLFGIAAFGMTSLVCGLSDGVTTLCVARAFQGIGAAFLVAPGLAIIGNTFHGEVERSHAWAIWGAIMGLTMALSPVIGGAIAYVLGWRWTFFVNGPICAVLGAAVLFVVDETRDDEAGAPDLAGIVLFSTAMFGLTLGLINGQDLGWTALPSLAGFGIGFCAIVAFITVESMQVRPMLDLGLFRLPRFVAAVLAMFAYATGAQVMASLLPQFLQNGFGRTPIAAGVAMLPFATAMLIFPYVGRRLGRLLSSSDLLVLGLCVVAAGDGLAAIGAHGQRPIVTAVGMLVLGAGGGLLNGETQKAIMSAVPRARSGMASGISTTSRFAGILFGFAFLSGLLATTIRIGLKGSAAYGARPQIADAIAAGDLQSVLGGLASSAREATLNEAHRLYCDGFTAALVAAAFFAVVAASFVFRLSQS